jgi:Tol biopolymer transport system component
LEIRALDWVPDATGLVISAQDNTSAFYHLWFIDYPQGQERKITNDLNDYLTVSASSAPLMLLSVQRQTLTNIWVERKGDMGRPLQLTSGAGRFFDTRWTSDGKILYASDASGSADIWEMAADGTGQKQLTAGAGRNYAPVASPDGRYVVFHSNRSGRWQIWRMDRDGGNPLQLTNDKEESNWPEFSPDGQWVFYQHVDGGTPKLWKVDINGQTPVRLSTTLSMRPAISADGKYLAYWQKEQKPTAPWRIVITSLDGQEPAKFVDVPQNEANGISRIQLTPDGNSVLFISFRNGTSNLMSQSFDNSAPKAVTSYTKEQFYAFDLARDGRLLLSHGLRTTDVVAISDAR